MRNKREKRVYTKKCYLSKNDAKVQVCQKIFRKLLTCWSSVVFDAINKRNSSDFDAIDNRGKHEQANKTKPEILEGIRSHIKSFPCMESHSSI